MQKLGEFIQRVSKKGKEQDDTRWLSRLHHILMEKYGWIPFEEFNNLPLPTIWNLYQHIVDDYEREKEEMEKVKHKGRR